MTQKTRKDTLFAKHTAHQEFIFDQKVVDVFPDMIKRSVPGYSTVIHMIGQMAQRFATQNSRCYDLGCSLGAATLSMRHQITEEGVSIVAVDNSQDMIAQAQKMIDNDTASIPVELLYGDINTIDINNASVVVLNFTLQFIDIALRNDLLKKIYQGMNSNGILILSEKLTFEDKAHDKLVTDLHHYFKASNGYSELEIAQKRAAIENVLIPETPATHKKRLLNAGFKSADIWFQCFNFASIVATK